MRKAKKTESPSQRAGKIALVFFLSLLLVPVVGAAPGISQTLTERDYASTITVVYDGTNTIACHAYFPPGGGGNQWSNAYQSSTNHGQSVATTTLDGGNSGFAAGCARGANNTIAATYGTSTDQTTCELKVISGPVVTRSFGNQGTSCSFGGESGSQSAEPIFFSSGDLGIFGKNQFHFWNGTALGFYTYPLGNTVRADSTMVDNVAKIVVASNNGRLYSVSMATVKSAPVFSEIQSAGVSGFAKPNIKFDGTTYRVCYVTTGGGIVYGTSTNFLTWNFEVVVTSGNYACTVATTVAAVAGPQFYYYKEGSTWNNLVHNADDICVPAGFGAHTSSSVDMYSVNETVYLWHRYCDNISPDFAQFRLTIIAGNIATPAQPGNPIGDALDYFVESWGIDAGVGQWLFGITTVAMVTFGFASATRGRLIPTALGALLGVGLAVAFGFLPIWFLLLIVLLVLAFVSNRLFGGAGDEDN